MEAITRRRALLITPFAFAGLVAVSSRKGSDSEDGAAGADAGQDLTIIAFDDAGQRLGPRQVQKVVRSRSQWRKLLSTEQYYVTREQGTDTPYTGTYYRIHDPGMFRCVCCEN